MNIRLTARHQKISADDQETIKNQFAKIEKFAEKITSCHIILDVEHVNQTVEVIVNLQRTTVSAKSKGPNTQSAADMTLQKIERQLKKINQKNKDHKIVKEPIWEENESEE